MTEDSQEIELRDNAEEAVRLIDDRKGVEAVEAALTADRSLGQIEIRRVEFVGPQVGRDLQIQAVYVVIAGIIAILAYIAFRFDLKGGVAAVVAVVSRYEECRW